MTARIAVSGAGGRMGREIVKRICDVGDAAALAAAVEAPNHPDLGKDAGTLAGCAPCSVLLSDEFSPQGVDVLIDFSAPAATAERAAQCRRAGIALVVGATGFSESEVTAVRAAADDIALVMAPNMSVGVNVMFDLAERAAAMLGREYDMEVFEAHHREKKDAPSGTALKLGEAMAKGSDLDFSKAAVYGRHGRDSKRKDGEIGFAAVRGGDIVGEHRAIFAGAGEQLEIVHRSTSRANYAAGAVRAAIFAAGAPAGLYDMTAVLGM